MEVEAAKDPWNVESIYEFQYFICADHYCSHKSHSKQEFWTHIEENHIEHLLVKKSIKDGSLSDISIAGQSQTSMVRTVPSNTNPLKRGPPSKDFFDVSPKAKKAKLQPAFEKLKQICEDENCPFNVALGCLGVRYYHESDKELEKLFQKIANDENPLKTNSVKVDQACRLKEKCGLGQDLYNEVRKVMTEGGLGFPSRYQLDKFRQEIKPEIKDFINGKWQNLYTTMKSTLTELFDVHFIEPESDHLECWTALGFDLSGSHKQFQFRDIHIDSQKIIYGL